MLDERELTDAERAAIADEPRPGVWIEQYDFKHFTDADGRPLSQHQTDRLIAFELSLVTKGRDMPELERIAGALDDVDLGAQHAATSQRGGIHSDPLVRLLAFRAWGDRDRAWRKRDTARVLTRDVLEPGAVDRLRRAYGFEGVEQRGAAFTAQRDGRQATASVNERDMLRGNRPVIEYMLDAFDELDAALSAGGEPVPSGPLTFDLSSSPR